MHEATPHRIQKELGRLATSTWRTGMRKLEPMGGFLAFFALCPCVAYLARMKTPTLMVDGRSRAMPCQRGMHAQVRV